MCAGDVRCALDLLCALKLRIRLRAASAPCLNVNVLRPRRYQGFRTLWTSAHAAHQGQCSQRAALVVQCVISAHGHALNDVYRLAGTPAWLSALAAGHSASPAHGGGAYGGVGEDRSGSGAEGSPGEADPHRAMPALEAASLPGGAYADSDYSSPEVSLVRNLLCCMPQLIQFRPNRTSPPMRTLSPVLLIARSVKMHALWSAPLASALPLASSACSDCRRVSELRQSVCASAVAWATAPWQVPDTRWLSPH